jgi:DNA-binding response OmpR family regulator
MMPGLNGYQVAAKIKSDLATTNTPIIMVSAVTDRNARTLALGAGADDFLTKPLHRDELVLRVRNLCTSRYVALVWFSGRISTRGWPRGWPMAC